MAASEGISGYGVTLSHSAVPATSYAAVGEITNVGGPDITADDIDLSHAASPDQVREYIAGFGDGGELNIDVIYNAGDTSAVYAVWRIKRTWKVTLPDGVTWTCVGYLRDIGTETPHDDKVTANWVIKLTGKPALAGAS